MTIKPTLAHYCPESIPGAKVVNLVANIPYSIESISRFSKIPGDYVVSLMSFSLSGTTAISFYANVDGTFRTIDSQSYACYNLDRDEDVFVNAKTTLSLNLLSTAALNNIPIRYLIKVSKPSVIEKLLLGIKLNVNDTPINNMFSLGNRVAIGDIPVIKPLLVARKQIARTITAGAGANPQIGETVTVPKNRYVMLDEIAVDGYEAAVYDNYIIVNRDLDDEYVKLNCFAMPPFVTGVLPDIPLSYPMTLGIPALDKLSVHLENGGAVNDWRVRYKYSVYVLTIPDKLRWGLALTADEDEIVESNNLESKVKAGLV